MLRGDDTGGRAVGVSDDEARVKWGRVEGSLLWDDVEVVKIDEGHDQRDIGIPAIRLGVGENSKFGCAKGSLCNHRMYASRQNKRRVE